MIQTELIWKDIQGYEGIYQVSNLGVVRSLVTGKEKVQSKKSNGYYHVSLWKNNKGKFFYVHRLVAIHFIGNPQSKETVNHIDGNKKNNCICNLEWATMKENVQHAFHTGLNVKEKNNPKISSPVSQFDLQGNFLNRFPSMREAERVTGVTATSIGLGIKNGWKYGGYEWKLEKNMEVN